MQYKCQICHDTGNKEKDMGGHLTCIACEAPAERMALEAFIESLPAMGEQEQAWRIHQRALAMAPKQEAQEPVAEVSAMPGTSGFTMAVFKADDMPIGSKVYAATAAANGAQYLTRVADFLADAVGGYSGGLADRIEEVIKQLRLDAGCGACGDACKGMTCRLQDESPSAVAAGSDAALVDAKHLVDITTAIMSQHGLIDHLSIGAMQEFCDDLCAALSGAKGN